MGRQDGQASLERNVQFASPVSVEIAVEEGEEDFLKEIDDFITAGSKADYESAFRLLRRNEKKVIYYRLPVVCNFRGGLLFFLNIFFLHNCIGPLAFLPWAIQLQQSGATKHMVHAWVFKCFHYPPNYDIDYTIQDLPHVYVIFEYACTH